METQVFSRVTLKNVGIWSRGYPYSWWVGLVVWGFEPLVLLEGKWGNQSTNPNH